MRAGAHERSMENTGAQLLKKASHDPHVVLHAPVQERDKSRVVKIVHFLLIAKAKNPRDSLDGFSILYLMTCLNRSDDLPQAPER